MQRYRIYCKLPGSVARPLGGDGLVVNLIHAEVFTAGNEQERARLARELAHIQKHNVGTWTLREVKDD